VSLSDICRAFGSALDRGGSIASGEIIVVSEEGYLPHTALIHEISSGLGLSRPAVFPVPVVAARWGTHAMQIWDRVFHPRIHLRPWMAEFATLPFCVDTRKARRDLGWTPRFHISAHIRRTIAQLRSAPEEWFERRELTLRPRWLRSARRLVLHTWDLGLGPLALDARAFLRFATFRSIDTLVVDDAALARYRAIAERGGRAVGSGVRFNLHRVELPCRIPWRILLRVISVSWPTSLVEFTATKQGYEYRLLGRWTLLRFEKVGEEKETSIEYRVTGGFAAGGYQTFVPDRDPETGRHYLYIDTRVPRDRPFPVRLHNVYTASHLENIQKNLFRFRLRHGETLL
jgi:hypothetical protein